MSQENVEIAREALSAMNGRDFDALRDLFSPDVEMDWSASRGLDAGVYRGIDTQSCARSRTVSTAGTR
jgi:ketosteroid isomerase-like protein